jgi:hypothetical protein
MTLSIVRTGKFKERVQGIGAAVGGVTVQLLLIFRKHFRDWNFLFLR